MRDFETVLNRFVNKNKIKQVSMKQTQRDIALGEKFWTLLINQKKFKISVEPCHMGKNSITDVMWLRAKVDGIDFFLRLETVNTGRTGRNIGDKFYFITEPKSTSLSILQEIYDRCYSLIRPVRSIFIEADTNTDETLMFLFEKMGITDKMEIIASCHQLPKETLFTKILESNQICFRSSMIHNSDSALFVFSIIKQLSKMGIEGKIFRSGGHLLDALNNNSDLSIPGLYSDFFFKNHIFEINNGYWSRIVYKNGKFEFII